MSAISVSPRKRSFVVRDGELQECLVPGCHTDLGTPPVEVLSSQSPAQKGFDSLKERLRDGFDAAVRRPPLELNPVNRLLTSADFQQHLQETLEGTSPRAQQVKQVESTYQAFWKDAQDFSVRQAQGPALSVPEPPRYEAAAETAWKGRALTVPEFQAVGSVPERERVQQPAQASAALLESRRVAELAEAPFSLLGRVELRA